MTLPLLSLEDHRWYVWQAGDQQQPVFVTAFRPLRPAAGVIRIQLVRVRYPMAAQKIVIDFRVTEHGEDYLAGTYLDEQRAVCAAVLRAISNEWLVAYMRGVSGTHLAQEDETIDDPQECASTVFGASEYEILNWSHELALPLNDSCATDQTAYLPLWREYMLFESNDIREGFLPRDDITKWRMSFQSSELVIARHLTGRVVYRVHFDEYERCLSADFAHATRNVEVCPHPDPNKDRSLILSLIDVYLLRSTHALLV
jgi:hypothetical protein